jgi:hypothetical protein
VLWIYLAEHGITVKVRASSGRHVLDHSQFYYAEANCQGPAYSKNAGLLLQPNIPERLAWFVTSLESAPVVVRSSGPAGDVCQGETEAMEWILSTVTPVDPEADLGLVFPLPAPLYVAHPLE